MEIETDSFLKTRAKKPDDPAMDRALKAEALAADAIRLMVASMSITDALLTLVEHRQPKLVADLRKEIGLMRARITDIATTMQDESEEPGG